MNVAFVLDDTLDKPDGVQQFVMMTGRWLAGRGHNVSYFVTETKRTDVPGVHSLGRYVSGSFNGNRVRTPLPASRARIRRALAEVRPDVLHVQLPCSPFMGGRVVAAAGNNTAVVGTFHILPSARWHEPANRMLGVALRRTARRFDCVTAVSEPAAEFARRTYGLNVAAVVPNPVETARFAAAGGGRGQRAPGGPVMVKFLGRLVARKGVLQLVRAFLALPADTRAHARLMVGGSGPLAAEAKRLAGAETNISFIGFVAEEDKPAFLAGADVAVFPSTGGESFGISLIEAMAAGAGVVLGGNNPGYASVLGGQPDSLVVPNDTERFVRQLEHFINDAAAREQLHRAQAELVKQFDINVVGPQIEAIYKRALSK